MSTELHSVRQAPLLSHPYGVQSSLVPVALIVVCSPSQVAPETHLFAVGSQELPAAHSASFVHVSLQAVGPHA